MWEILTWLWALPMSSSHALVGGLLGAGVAALGTGGIDWNKVILVFAALLISPFLGIITGYLIMRLSRLFFSKTQDGAWPEADRFYKHMQILSSSWVSFSHGSNDATKVMGIIVVFLAAQRRERISMDYPVPLWVILSCAAAMAIGTFLSVKSFRLIRTLGEKITKLHPINGFSAETGGAIIIQVASLARTACFDHARGHLGGHRHRSGQQVGRGQLESLPCYHAGLGGHPAVLRYRGRYLLLPPRLAGCRGVPWRSRDSTRSDAHSGVRHTLEGAIDAMGKEREEQVLERLAEFS